MATLRPQHAMQIINLKLFIMFKINKRTVRFHGEIRRCLGLAIGQDKWSYMYKTKREWTLILGCFILRMDVTNHKDQPKENSYEV